MTGRQGGDAPVFALELVMHDWRNMAPEEREQALTDIRTLAATHTGRRARALNIVASFFHFLSPKDEGR